MIELYERGGKLVDKSGKRLLDAERPELDEALLIGVVVHLSAPAESGMIYRLAGDTTFRSTDLMFAATPYRIDGRDLFFDVDTYTHGFYAKATKGRQRIRLELTSKSAEPDAKPRGVLMDYLFCSPRVEVPGVPPVPLAKYYTRDEIDALLADIELTPGPEGPGMIDNPAAGLCVLDPDWGDCHYLDDVTPTVQFFGRQNDVIRVELELVSADATAGGNVVIVPVVGGVDASPVVIAVGATPARASFALAVNGETLALRRDHAHDSDTLKDAGGVISALLLWGRFYTRKTVENA